MLAFLAHHTRVVSFTVKSAQRFGLVVQFSRAYAPRGFGRYDNAKSASRISTADSEEFVDSGATLNRQSDHSKTSNVNENSGCDDASGHFAEAVYKNKSSSLPKDKENVSREEEAEFPSDRVQQREQREQSRHAFRPKIHPSETSIMLFPGQGSQFVGMGSKLIDYPNVLELYEKASRILGYDLLELCLRGPREKLNSTVHCQPAVLVTALAAVEKLKHQHPHAIQNCISVAGYSVGEYAALVFAGAMSFEDAVRVVKVRATVMQSASQIVPSAMMTVYFNADGRIRFACYAAKLYCTKELGMNDAVCEIANYLYPGCKVIAGNQEALKFIERNAAEFGIQRVQYLPVSGAFHSRLMHPAIAALSRSLASVQIQKPIVPVHSNVTALRYHTPTSIRKLLVEQMWKPVRWEQIMHVLYSRQQGTDFPHTYEIGPGRQMGAILRHINVKAFAEYHNVDT